MTRSAYTLSLHQFQVSVDSGFIVSNQAILDAVNLPLDDINNFPYISPCASAKVGKLYFVDMRSILHKAFDELVDADGGTIISQRQVARSINKGDFNTYSVFCGATAVKVGKLYAYTPLTQSESVTSANITVTGVTTTPKYRISDIPIIDARFTNTTTLNTIVEVLNRRSAYGIRFYEADGVANNFNLVSEILPNTFSNTITGNGATFDHTSSNALAYKYKVSYFVTGSIDSNTTNFEGTRCQPSYLLGE
jgi:hypothetical protein